MSSSPESGNVIFYILLAVALLGALSFAVAQSDRGSITTITDDKARLYAGDFIAYGDTLAKAVTQMRLRGSSVAALSFAHPDAHADYGTYDSDPDNEVFNPAGGAVIYAAPEDDALDSAGAVYEFLSDNEIEQVGTTCGAAACADLIAALSGVKKPVCVAINDLLSVDNPSGDPPTDGGIDTTRFAGSFGYSKTVGDEVSSAALEGKSAGCFYDSGSAAYVFYQVLLPR
ncbi:MAG: hypothetical protein KDJ15_05700 [Alphaproteobacteria bacterium]|nr:hypothetical protein [Alphaproteobacteria bacterium]